MLSWNFLYYSLGGTLIHLVIEKPIFGYVLSGRYIDYGGRQSNGLQT